MSFTDGKPWISSEEDIHKNWGGVRDGSKFACGLCGVRFRAGDCVRWQYTNDIPGAGGNPFVCVACDAPKEVIVARMRWIHQLLRYWT